VHTPPRAAWAAPSAWHEFEVEARIEDGDVSGKAGIEGGDVSGKTGILASSLPRPPEVLLSSDGAGDVRTGDLRAGELPRPPEAENIETNIGSGADGSALASTTKKQRKQQRKDRHTHSGERGGDGGGGGPGGVSADEAIALCGAIILEGVSKVKLSVVRDAVAVLDGIIAQGGTRTDDLMNLRGIIGRQECA